jgi:hypothetical protein
VNLQTKLKPSIIRPLNRCTRLITSSVRETIIPNVELSIATGINRYGITPILILQRDKTDPSTRLDRRGGTHVDPDHQVVIHRSQLIRLPRIRFNSVVDTAQSIAISRIACVVIF